MTHDLKSSLEAFAEAAYADAPPSTIDVGRARADGRRRIAGARLASAGGGVAVVAACALVVNTLGGTSAAPAAPGTTTAAGPGHRTFTGTDPLIAIGHFGWLPDGLEQTMLTTGPDYGDTLTIRAPESPTAPHQVPQMLSLTRSATEPTFPPIEQKVPTTVTGSPKAYYVVNPADGAGIPADLSLVWQTASGDWFTLGGDSTIHGDALKARLTKVAESVSAERGPVPMPFHIEGLPKGVTLGEASLKTPVGHGGFEAAAMFHTTAPSGVGGLPPSFTVTAIRTGQQVPNPSDPKTSVPPELPAIIHGSPDPATGETSACKDSEGLYICVVDAPGPSGRSALASVGGAQGLLDRITSLGRDRSNWTTNVVN